MNVCSFTFIYICEICMCIKSKIKKSSTFMKSFIFDSCVKVAPWLQMKPMSLSSDIVKGLVTTRKKIRQRPNLGCPTRFFQL